MKSDFDEIISFLVLEWLIKFHFINYGLVLRTLGQYGRTTKKDSTTTILLTFLSPLPLFTFIYLLLHSHLNHIVEKNYSYC